MMPTFASPGVIRPGQLGPIRRLDDPSRKARTLTMSNAGMPSVMQMISLIPASAASMMALGAKRA
ncbi:MAG: hypothetical protein R2856_10030 [Caldilineaceae bacterium]